MQKMIEGVDYCLLFPKNDTKAVHIKFLSGPYKDTVYKYGKVKFKEEAGQMYLLFAYDVIESIVAKPKKLEKDEDFKNYIGDLLIELMSSNLDEENNESDDNDTKKPDLLG